MAKRYIILAVAVLSFLCAVPASAGFPAIDDLQNQWIPMNQSTPVMKFNVWDDRTPTNQLVITYRSTNPALVPNDDDHIDIGGSGSTRTVQIIPVPGKSGTATIILTVADTDGETNQDAFDVNVQPPPK